MNFHLCCAADHNKSGGHDRGRSGSYLKRRFNTLFRLLWLMAVFIIFICLSGCSSSGGDPSVSPVSSTPKNTNPNTSTDTKAIYIADADTDGVDELYVTDFGDPGVAT